jgi:hypothetical protein
MECRSISPYRIRQEALNLPVDSLLAIEERRAIKEVLSFDEQEMGGAHGFAWCFHHAVVKTSFGKLGCCLETSDMGGTEPLTIKSVPSDTIHYDLTERALSNWHPKTTFVGTPKQVTQQLCESPFLFKEQRSDIVYQLKYETENEIITYTRIKNEASEESQRSQRRRISEDNGVEIIRVPSGIITAARSVISVRCLTRIRTLYIE